jgi:uncharacterized membrane protein
MNTERKGGDLRPGEAVDRGWNVLVRNIVDGSTFGASDARGFGAGRLLFGVGFAVVGAIGLGAHDFVLHQQPVPKGLPWRETLASISGALLLLTGVGLLVARTARFSALVLTAFLLLWVVALQIPRLVMNPAVEGYWLGLGEDLTLVAGGWVLFCAIAGRNDGTVRASRAVFGLALVPIGLSHFVYLEGAAGLIPSWIPLHISLTCFTGAAHIAAGAAIVIGIVPRLAATLEAAMESLFTLIVWVTAVVVAPASRESWVNLFISTALSAAAWAVAESYGRAPWSFARRSSRQTFI